MRGGKGDSSDGREEGRRPGLDDERVEGIAGPAFIDDDQHGHGERGKSAPLLAGGRMAAEEGIDDPREEGEKVGHGRSPCWDLSTVRDRKVSGLSWRFIRVRQAEAMTCASSVIATTATESERRPAARRYWPRDRPPCPPPRGRGWTTSSSPVLAGRKMSEAVLASWRWRRPECWSRPNPLSRGTAICHHNNA